MHLPRLADGMKPRRWPGFTMRVDCVLDLLQVLHAFAIRRASLAGFLPFYFQPQCVSDLYRSLILLDNVAV